MTGLWRRLRYLLPWHRRAEENEMRAELESLACLAAPGELGNLTRAAEEARAAWGWTWLEQLWRDAQYAVRTLGQNRGFTATAVLSLALGIGANTAIFSLIDALMLHWLPVHNPQELVLIQMRDPREPEPADSFSYAIVQALDEEKSIFSSVCGFSGTTFDAGHPGSVSQVQGAWVTGGYYETLGLTPAAGRLLQKGDDRPGAPLAAILSYAYWQRQFAGNPAAIGQPVLLNGVPATVVGVSPRGFKGAEVGDDADITLAVSGVPQVEPSGEPLLGRGNFWLRVLARPRAGASRAETRARLAAAWKQIAARSLNPEWSARQREDLANNVLDIVPGAAGHTFLGDRFREPLMVLMAVAGLVMLIACANVASLLLARATARRREIAVRLAIGAGRARIVRQLLTESTMISTFGAALGIWLAWISSRFLLSTLADGGVPANLDLHPNWHILAFAVGLALANGIVFGLAPAWHTTAVGGAAVLQEGARTTRGHSRLLSSLVCGQVALSLLLLVGAGLFVRTLQNLLNVNPGFRREGVLVVRLDGAREGYRDARLREFYEGLLSRVRRVPGAVSASIVGYTPLSGWLWTEAACAKGEPLPHDDNTIFVAAGPDYFRTMGIPLLAGREFTAADRGDGRVAIVTRAFAERNFAGRNPVGEYVTATVSKPPSDLRIVGVAADSMISTLRDTPGPAVYVSYFQKSSATDSLVIRSAGSLTQTASAIRDALQPSFPNAPITVRPLTAQVEETLVEERLMAKLSGGFGVLGLSLACVGLYGLLAYSVACRTKEIGIRIALGAQRGAVRWLVAKRAMALIAIGIAAGLPAAWLLSRQVQTMLFGLTSTDTGILAGAIAALAVAGLAATYFPARRAAHLDAMTALRHE
ncbi:MAG TPA: ABC transporter permease [Bryobacteraceae bacterium]|jgi:predicted permease|nr:ABC transporter permease [Bryobacteraceae bacterium]